MNTARGEDARRPTMRQVADLAGVGTKTVSRVVNLEPNVSAATAERVWTAVRALDYHLDLQAGSLRRAGGRTSTVGLLVGSVDNPFSGAVHRAVEDVCAPHGVAVFASSIDDDPVREALAVEAFLRRRVDGLILTTAAAELGYLPSLVARRVPVVFVDRQPPGVHADVVSSDNVAAAETAVGHLLRHGHRRIAMLSDRTAIPTAAERQQGFRAALERAGVPCAQAPIVSGLHDEAAAERAMTDLLRSDDPPTAVFSAQNLITLGALHALHAAGAQRRIALVGIDDLPLADLVDPGVTVVAQDPQRIGRLAAERLFRRLDEPDLAPERIVTPTRLIARGSGEIRPV